MSRCALCNGQETAAGFVHEFTCPTNPVVQQMRAQGVKPCPHCHGTGRVPLDDLQPDERG